MVEVEQTYKFNVKMDCGGCTGAVGRALKKTEGVKSHEISLEKQEVLVKATIPYDDVLAKIKKTGKQVISGETVEESTEVKNGLDTPAASTLAATIDDKESTEVTKGLDTPAAPTLVATVGDAE